MNRRNFLKLGALGLATSIYGCSFNSPNLDNLRNDIKIIIDNMVTLKTHIKFEDNSQMNKSGEGLIVDDYIITCDHIVSNYGINTRTPFGNLFIPRVSKKNTTKLGNNTLEEVLRDYKRDIAIFKLPKDYNKPKPVKLGDDDKLKLLDRLYLIGDAYDLEYVVRPGYLGREEIVTLFSTPHDVIGKIFTGRLANGDSGSPIINQEGEVIGLASNTSDVYGVFKPINWYKKELGLK